MSALRRKSLVVVFAAALLCCRGTTFPGRLAEATATATATSTPTSTPNATGTDTPIPLRASCGPTRYDVSVDSPVVFDGRGSSTPHGPIRSYHWDFGDGTIGQGVTPTHEYHNDVPDVSNPTYHTFTVTLTIVDSALEAASCTTQCTVYAYY